MFYSMILRIDSEQLHSELRDKRDSIGNGQLISAVANVICSFFYIVDYVSSFCENWVRSLFGIGLAAIIIGLSAYNLRKVWLNRVTDESLYEVIVGMNRPLVKSSIIALTIGDGNRYLVYFDASWDCWFFPWHHTSANIDDDMNGINGYLSTEFGLSDGDFSLSLVASDEVNTRSTKRSTEHDEDRDYVYRLYRGTIDMLPDGWSESEEFMVRGRKCRLMTINDMLDDARIHEINGDVLNMVKSV